MQAHHMNRGHHYTAYGGVGHVVRLARNPCPFVYASPAHRSCTDPMLNPAPSKSRVQLLHMPISDNVNLPIYSPLLSHLFPLSLPHFAPFPQPSVVPVLPHLAQVVHCAPL